MNVQKRMKFSYDKETEILVFQFFTDTSNEEDGNETEKYNQETKLFEDVALGSGSSIAKRKQRDYRYYNLRIRNSCRQDKSV